MCLPPYSSYLLSHASLAVPVPVCWPQSEPRPLRLLHQCVLILAELPEMHRHTFAQNHFVHSSRAFLTRAPFVLDSVPDLSSKQHPKPSELVACLP